MRRLLHDAAKWGASGGYCDLTTGIQPGPHDPEAVSAAEAAQELYSAGVPWSLISFSSDAQGSIPGFDAQGRLAGMEVGTAASLFHAVLSLHEATGWSWTQCLRPVTTTPADILGLEGAGCLAPGRAADCVLVRDNMIDTVIAQGRVMVKDKLVKVYGTFEQAR
jgi:beta-aspartyl-dipeptidase (metallo-type)